MPGSLWEVVGGAGRGGIIVRSGQELSSQQAPRRLATGALVRQEELVGERLRFRKLAGQGPDCGWVSLRLHTRELLVQAAQAAAPADAAAAPRAPPASPAAGPVAKRVWAVRHGEAEHNVLIDQGLQASHLRDPGLSPLGTRQARAVADDPVVHGSGFGPPGSPARAEVIVSSPCLRALQTATLACAASAKRPDGLSGGRVTVVALPDLQECTDNPCDTGRPRTVLEQEFPDVDFSELAARPDDWFTKLGCNRGEEGREALRQRCCRVTAWLAARPEQRIVLVAHRTLFCYMLQLDFAPAEVIELRLLPPGAGPGARAAGQAPGAWRWEPAVASEELVPFYNWKDEPLCSQGSPPLRGTLSTCLRNRGEEAARNTARRAGRPPPLRIPGLC